MQWRDLYTTLTQRMKDKMIQHGQRMRQLREDEKSIHRPKVGLVSIRTTKTIEKREAILSGALGTKHHLQSISSSTSNGKNKLQQLRKEVSAASSRMQRMIQIKKS